MYLWEIKWKKYNEQSLFVNERVKDLIEAEWVKKPEQRAKDTFKFAEETYSYSAIESINKTTKKDIDNTKLLYAAEADLQNEGPLLDGEGYVTTNWYKKLVTTREFENYYGKHPSYYTLSRDTNGVWIAERLAVKVNGSVPDTVELCTEQEAEKLWKYLKAN